MKIVMLLPLGLLASCNQTEKMCELSTYEDLESNRSYYSRNYHAAKSSELDIEAFDLEEFQKAEVLKSSGFPDEAEYFAFLREIYPLQPSETRLLIFGRDEGDPPNRVLDGFYDRRDFSDQSIQLTASGLAKQWQVRALALQNDPLIKTYIANVEFNTTKNVEFEFGRASIPNTSKVQYTCIVKDNSDCSCGFNAANAIYNMSSDEVYLPTGINETSMFFQQ